MNHQGTLLEFWIVATALIDESSGIRQSAVLEILKKHPGRVVRMSVSDNGPGMSGLDVAREVRAIRKELPIAITSGFIDEDLRVEATRVGAIELISKPFMTQDFFAIVKRLASGEESRSIKFVQERTRYEVDAD